MAGFGESGGVQAMWSANGKEIYYRDGQHLVSVSFDGTHDEPIIGHAVPLFPDEYDLGWGITLAN